MFQVIMIDYLLLLIILFKDLITIFIFIFVLSLFVFFMPNVLGDSDNYIMANPMQTPPAIVPEWYLITFLCYIKIYT